MWFLYCIYIVSLIGRLVNSHTSRHQNRRNKQYREREFVDCVYSLVIILLEWRFYFDSHLSTQNKYYSFSPLFLSLILRTNTFISSMVIYKNWGQKSNYKHISLYGLQYAIEVFLRWIICIILSLSFSWLYIFVLSSVSQVL